MSLVKKIIEILCAIYTRVSSEDQLHAVYGSIEKQQDMCLLHIGGQEGWSHQETFSDPAVSGKEWDRDGLQAMLSSVSSGKIKMVVVYHSSRLSRKLVDTMLILEHLYKHGCGCFSLREGFIDISTPDARYFAAQRAAQNELEHGKIVESVQDGVTLKVAKGGRQGGRAPWGFTNDIANSTIVPDPVVGPIVKEVFERVANGESLGAIADDLNSRGLRTPFHPNERNGKGAGGRLFDTDFLWAIIKNVAYKGYGRAKLISKAHIPKPDGIDVDGMAIYKGKHYENRLIDEELWALANAKAGDKKRKFSSPDAFKRRGDSPLMGLIKCGHCGCGMTTAFTDKKTSEGVRRHRYYRCQKLVEEGKGHPCDVRCVPAELIEAIIFRSLSPLGQHPDIIREAVAAAVLNKRDHASEAREKLRETENELRRLKQQETNLIEVLRSKGAAALSERIVSEIDILKNTQSTLGQERRALATTVQAAEANYPNADSIAAGIANVEKVVAALSVEKQHELLQYLITDISVFTIHRVPFGASQPVQPSTVFMRVLIRLRGSRAYLLSQNVDSSSLQGGDKKRETLTVPVQLDVEIPCRWQKQGFRLLAPVAEQLHLTKLSPDKNVDVLPVAAAPKQPHAIAKAVAWDKELRQNPKLTQSKIAVRHNVDRASVCQYLSLLKLPLSVRMALLAPGQSQEVLSYFGLRALLRLLKKPDAQREAEFARQMKKINQDK